MLADAARRLFDGMQWLLLFAALLLIGGAFGVSLALMLSWIPTQISPLWFLAIVFGIGLAGIGAIGQILRARQSSLPSAEQFDTPPADDRTIGDWSPAPRVEPQFLQAAVGYWVSLNNSIWQQLVMVVLMQSYFVTAGFTYAPSLISVGALGMGMVLSVLVIIHMRSNIQVRQNVTQQVNYMSVELLTPFFNEGRPYPVGLRVPFILYNPDLDRKEWFVRSPTSALGVLATVVLFDTLCFAIFNFPDFFARQLSFLPWPLVPHTRSSAILP
jgi:hypothetical protein